MANIQRERERERGEREGERGKGGREGGRERWYTTQTDKGQTQHTHDT